MYLPFCGISISNAKLFSESRKEYERSRVRSFKELDYQSLPDLFSGSKEPDGVAVATGLVGGGQ